VTLGDEPNSQKGLSEGLITQSERFANYARILIAIYTTGLEQANWILHGLLGDLIVADDPKGTG